MPLKHMTSMHDLQLIGYDIYHNEPLPRDYKDHSDFFISELEFHTPKAKAGTPSDLSQRSIVMESGWKQGCNAEQLEKLTRLGLKAECKEDYKVTLSWPEDSKVDDFIVILKEMQPDLSEVVKAELRQTLLYLPRDRFIASLEEKIRDGNVSRAFDMCEARLNFKQDNSHIYFELAQLLERYQHTKDAARAYGKVMYHESNKESDKITYKKAREKFFTLHGVTFSAMEEKEKTSISLSSETADELMKYARNCHEHFLENFRRSYSDFMDETWSVLIKIFDINLKLEICELIPKTSTVYLEAQKECAFYYFNYAEDLAKQKASSAAATDDLDEDKHSLEENKECFMKKAFQHACDAKDQDLQVLICRTFSEEPLLTKNDNTVAFWTDITKKSDTETVFKIAKQVREKNKTIKELAEKNHAAYIAALSQRFFPPTSANTNSSSANHRKRKLSL